MSYQECIDFIERAMDKDGLSEKDLAAIDKRVSGLMKDLQANNQGQSIEQALMKALNEDAERLQINALLAKRNAVKNQIARVRELSKLRANFGHDYAEGLQGLAGGSMTAAKGGKDSTSARIAAQQGYYGQGLISELEAAGTHRILAGGEFDEPLAHALYELSMEAPDLQKLSKIPGMTREVMDSAKIIGKWQEKTRLDRNEAGAWIGRLEGYIAGRKHDMAQIKQAGREKWTQWMSEHMDWDRSMPDLEIADRGKELNRMYSDFVAGEHLKFQEGPREALPPGFANIGKKASRERVLFFKDAAGEFDYHRLYGGGDSLMSNILGDMDRAGREVAIMRKLGPNAKATFDDIYDSLQKELREKNDEPAREKLKNNKVWIDNYLWPQITGEARIPVDIGFAQASGAVRNIFTMSKLALAPITQLMDNVGVAMAHKNLGGTMLGGMADSLKSWADMARPYMKDDVELMGYMGMMLDHMRGFHSSPYETGMDTTGLIAKATQRVMKWNGMTRIRDKEVVTFMGLTGNRLASRSDVPHAKLEAGLRQILGEYGIGEKEWDIVRSMDKQSWRGNEVFTPEGVRIMAPERVDPLIEDGIKTIYDQEKGMVERHADLRERNLGWLDGRIEAFHSKQAGLKKRINDYLWQKVDKLGELDKTLSIRADLLRAQLEEAEVKTDISSFLLTEKDENRMRVLIDDLKDGLSAEKGAARSDRLIERYGMSRGSKGETLGRRQGIVEMKIASLDKKLAEAEKESAGLVDKRAKEVRSKIADMGVELSRFKLAMQERIDASAERVQQYQDSIGGRIDGMRQAAKQELEDKLRTFFTDQTNTAVLNRDDMTNALLLRGTRPGSKEGEALRHVMMFKSFTATFMRRVLGREVYGHGLEKEPLYKQLFNIVKDGKTDSMSGLANIIAWSTAMGYGVYALKSLAKGRVPQWPDNTEEALSVTKTAIAQGGGLGIYGDFLFWRGKETMGKGSLESFLGPTLGTAEDVWSLTHTDSNNKSAKAAKMAFSVVPNLFYTKAAFDYLIAYRTMEWLNPGSVARMQQNIKKDQGEEFYIQPSGN